MTNATQSIAAAPDNGNEDTGSSVDVVKLLLRGNYIIDNLIATSKVRLPVFDTTAARIQQETGKEEPNVNLIEKLITSDQALTAQVLSVSNSSFYRGLTQVSTVRNAIVRLGINEVSNIVVMVTHENNFQSKNPFVNDIMRQLWRHSLGCALASHWLAKHCGLTGIAHETFFAGLLHDVGKLFILTVIDDLVHSGKLTVDPSPALMMEAMDTLHTGHGYTLMSHWNIPEKYSTVARDHHNGEFDQDNYLDCIVRLADKTCNKMEIGLKVDPELVLVATDEAAALRLSDVDIAKMQIHLEDSSVYQAPESEDLPKTA